MDPATDPATFRKELLFPAGRGTARLADILADFQARDFAAMDPAFVALTTGSKPDVGRFWIERTKGGSKDSDIAAMILWLLAFSPRPLACQVGAADADQANEVRKRAKSILRLNSWLGPLIDIQAMSILSKNTDGRCDIIAADVAGSHGAIPDLLVLNELSHVTKQEFAQNLLDNASKVPHGVAIIATNSGFQDTWQWDWRENARTSERWYFSALSEPAPWLDPAEIAEAKARNPSMRFRRLWGGEWLSGDELSVFNPADIEAAFTDEVPPIIL